MPQLDEIRTIIRQTLNEAKTANDLVDMVFRLRVRTSGETDPQITDVMTNIRVIKGVAIARQVTPVIRIKGGRDVLQLGIKFMPFRGGFEEMVNFLGKEMRKVEGVEIVMLLTLGGREVRKEDNTPYLF